MGRRHGLVVHPYRNAAGGGGRYADNAVGFLGDFEVFRTTTSDTTQSTVGASPTMSYGDYFSVRNAWGSVYPAAPGIGYSTLGCSVDRAVAANPCSVGGCNVNFTYVLFGRNGEFFPVVDRGSRQVLLARKGMRKRFPFPLRQGIDPKEYEGDQKFRLPRLGRATTLNCCTAP